jgi:hypothetical protein
MPWFLSRSWGILNFGDRADDISVFQNRIQVVSGAALNLFPAKKKKKKKNIKPLTFFNVR